MIEIFIELLNYENLGQIEYEKSTIIFTTGKLWITFSFRIPPELIESNLLLFKQYYLLCLVKILSFQPHIIHPATQPSRIPHHLMISE